MNYMVVDVIDKADIESFIYNLWSTQTFRNLHNKNLFFKNMIKKISELPLFFHEAKSNKQKNHLTSFFRLISYRTYENKYIQDLYYFHELCHLINYEPKNNISYDDWSSLLNENELYASIMSEVVIYFFDEDLYRKTFSPLWANFFIHDIFNNKKYKKTSFGMYYNTTLQEDIDRFHKEKNTNLFNLDPNNWPENINNVISRRRELRENKQYIEKLYESEKTIVSYNEKRELWINDWEDSYIKINNLLLKFKETQSINFYLDTINQNTNEELIVFPLKKSVSISTN